MTYTLRITGQCGFDFEFIILCIFILVFWNLWILASNNKLGLHPWSRVSLFIVFIFPCILLGQNLFRGQHPKKRSQKKCWRRSYHNKAFYFHLISVSYNLWARAISANKDQFYVVQLSFFLSLFIYLNGSFHKFLWSATL